MSKKVMNRRFIFDSLCEFMKGQEEYAEYLATIAFKFMLITDCGLDSQLKETPLITGPTGVGKTYGLKCLSKIIDVPLYIADASTFTKAGYTGNTVSKYIVECLKDSEKKEAIFVFDEIDKMMDSNVNGFSNAAYYELLKVIEDSSVTFGSSTIPLDNVFFILSGSFERIRGRSTGIYSTKKERLTAGDLQDFGIPPELLGRISRIVELKPLKEDDFRSIISDSKESCISLMEDFFSQEQYHPGLE